MRHSQEAAEAILAPHMDDLAGLFPGAWDDWEKLGEACPELRMQMCKRTRASMLSNFAATRALAVFDGKAPDVTLTDKPGFLLVGFDSQLYMRLKKYRDGSFQTCGIPTDQRRLFEGQQPLTGMQESTNIVLGYILNEDATGITSTAIKCSTHGTVHWTIDVPFPDEGMGTVLDHRPKPVSPLLPGSGIVEPGISSTIRKDGEGAEGIGG